MIIRPSNRISEVKEYYFSTKLAEIAGLEKQGRTIINLGIGSPDLLPPNEVLQTLYTASLESEANKYQSYRGLPELREAFGGHYRNMLGVNMDPTNEILPLIGSKEGIMHISMSFLDKGDEVLVPNPGYPSYRVCAELAGASVKYFDLTEQNAWLPDMDQLADLYSEKLKIIWINYPNMPTGAVADKKRLEELIEFCLTRRILLCHDNPYNMILNDNPFSVLSLPGAKECTLELYSLSKAFNMSGWRVGAVLGEKVTIDTILRYKSNMDSGMYKPIQKAASVALGLDLSWFESLNKVYRKRRENARDIMSLLDCRYEEDTAGMFVWARVPDYVVDVAKWIDDILYNAGVFITPGFIFGSNGDRYIRISLCSPEEDFQKAFLQIDHHFIQSMVRS